MHHPTPLPKTQRLNIMINRYNYIYKYVYILV